MLCFYYEVFCLLVWFFISSKRDLPKRIKIGKFRYGAGVLNVSRQRTSHFRDTAKNEYKIHYMCNKSNKLTFIACFDNAS